MKKILKNESDNTIFGVCQSYKGVEKGIQLGK